MQFQSVSKMSRHVNTAQLSHDDLRLSHRGSYGLVRQDFPSIEIDFILDYDIFSQHTHILHPHPSSNDAAVKTGLVFDNKWSLLTPILLYS